MNIKIVNNMDSEGMILRYLLSSKGHKLIMEIIKDKRRKKMISAHCSCGGFFDDIRKLDLVIIDGKGKLKCSVCDRSNGLNLFDPDLKKYFERIQPVKDYCDPDFRGKGSDAVKKESKLVDCNDKGESHEFSPRYNKHTGLLCYESYLFDICKKCGKVVNRQKEDDG